MNTQNEPHAPMGCNAPTPEAQGTPDGFIPPPPPEEPPPPPEEPLPQLPPFVNIPPPVFPAAVSGTSWSPKPNVQRMSRARYRLRCKEAGKENRAWHKKHWLSWVLPLALNILAALLWAIAFFDEDMILLFILCILLLFVAEILLLVYSIRFLLFVLQSKYRNDCKLRMQDLGQSPALVWLPAIVMIFAALLIESSFVVLLVFLVCLLPFLLLYALPGNPGPNKYGPVPDDEPTPEK